MNNIFSTRLKELRKRSGMSQEQLAECFNISVQAVSKWECMQSYPDIELLPEIADIFDVSIDYLLREKIVEIESADMPDDNVLRVVQYQGNKLIRRDNYNGNGKIPLCIDKSCTNGVNIQIWGSTEIEGDINGNVDCGNGLMCENVGGNVQCGDGVMCGNVGGNLQCGDGVNCGNVGGGITCADGVNCGNVGGNITCNGNIECGNIEGNIVNCVGEIHCLEIKGSVSCEKTVYITK